VFFDGTFWAADEAHHPRPWRQARGGHGAPAIGGAAGSLARLANINVARRYFIHINNTNPILREDSAEHAAVEAAGWRVAL